MSARSTISLTRPRSPLPKRLETVAQHLPELAERKRSPATAANPSPSRSITT
jgi:hypothetical protein